MTVGKRKKKRKSKRHFDTSVCQVVFLKARISPRRRRFFDHDRHLNFEHDRNIRARLQGVMFRKETYWVEFKNNGVSNIEDTAEPDDWPKMEKARSPDSMVLSRRPGYNNVWGRDRSYQQKWASSVDTDWDDALDPPERIPPQLSYYHLKEETKEDPNLRRTPTPKPQKRTEFMVERSKPAQKRPKAPPVMKPRDQPAWATRSTPQPVYEVVKPEPEPIIALPSRQEPTVQSIEHKVSDFIEELTKPAPVYESISPKDKKRAFAFNEYALNLMESGKYAKAMTYFQKARSLDPIEETYKINMKRCQQWLDYKLKRGR